jgi:hypothetical protein
MKLVVDMNLSPFWLGGLTGKRKYYQPREMSKPPIHRVRADSADHPPMGTFR